MDTPDKESFIVAVGYDQYWFATFNDAVAFYKTMQTATRIRERYDDNQRVFEINTSERELELKRVFNANVVKTETPELEEAA